MEQTETEWGELSDRALLELVYERYSGGMYETARKLLRDAGNGAAAEVVQECLLNLVRKADTLRRLNRQTLAAYITFTVRNACLNRNREDAYRGEHTVSAADPRQRAPEAAAPSAEAAYLAAERSRALRARFDALGETDRALLLGRYRDDLDDAALARQIGCGPASVRMKLTRARRRARRALESGAQPELFIQP